MTINVWDYGFRDGQENRPMEFPAKWHLARTVYEAAYRSGVRSKIFHSRQYDCSAGIPPDTWVSPSNNHREEMLDRHYAGIGLTVPGDYFIEEPSGKTLSLPS